MPGSADPRRKSYPHFPGNDHDPPTLTLDEIVPLARLLASRLFEEALNGTPVNGGKLLSDISDIVYGYDTDPKNDNALINKLKSIVPEIGQQANDYDVSLVWSYAMSIYAEVLGAFELLIQDYDNDSNPVHSSDVFRMAMPDPRAKPR